MARFSHGNALSSFSYQNDSDKLLVCYKDRDMSNNLRHRNCNTENPVVIKIPYYFVTMVITKLLQAELNRIVQEVLIDTKFADFGEGSV